jgi:hypothetical protein
MKNLLWKNAFYITLCTLLLAACSSDWTGEDQKDTATISISLGGTAGRAMTGFNDAVDSANLSYVVTLINCDTGETEEIPINLSTNTATKTQVVPGTYRVTVDAFVWGWPYAFGSHSPFPVAAGEVYQAPIVMERILDAIVLNIPKDEPISFSSFKSGDPLPGAMPITIYNFTGSTSETISVSVAGGSGFILSTSTVNIAGQDGSSGFTITPSVTSPGVYDRSLNITGPGGFSASIDLSIISYIYTITTEAELAAIAGDLGGTYTLMNDITLSGTDWTPIGKSGARFTGTFDGNGYAISGLTINNISDDDPSLFGVIHTGAVVQNVGFVNVNIVNIDSNYGNGVGGVAGHNYGTIQNCYITGSITGYMYVGGIVGYNRGTIQNCYSTATVTSTTTSSVGGIAGAWGTIKNCYVAGTINGSSNAGGLVGNAADAKVSDNVALSQAIVGGTPANKGRIYGGTNTPTLLTNNYARVDMLVGGSTVSGSANDKHGADVALGTPLASVFSFGDWGNTAIWNIPGGNLVVGGALPTLVAVPQSPAPTLP